MLIRSPTDMHEVLAAADLFDIAPQPEATVRFLASPGHHLLIAYEEARPVGFVTGIEMTHPDKGTEMFVYELGVHEDYRRRGIGRALVERLRALAQEHGCYAMWVLTDEDNQEARGVYEASGAAVEVHQRLYSWDFAS